jgi:hypothetical protein
VSAFTIDFKFRRYAVPGRAAVIWLVRGCNDRNCAHLVIVHGLGIGISNGLGFSFGPNTNPKLVPGLSCLTYSNPERSGLAINVSVNTKRVAEVGMATFIKGPSQPDSWLY